MTQDDDDTVTLREKIDIARSRATQLFETACEETASKHLPANQVALFQAKTLADKYIHGVGKEPVWDGVHTIDYVLVSVLPNADPMQIGVGMMDAVDAALASEGKSVSRLVEMYCNLFAEEFNKVSIEVEMREIINTAHEQALNALCERYGESSKKYIVGNEAGNTEKTVYNVLQSTTDLNKIAAGIKEITKEVGKPISYPAITTITDYSLLFNVALQAQITEGAGLDNASYIGWYDGNKAL